MNDTTLPIIPSKKKLANNPRRRPPPSTTNVNNGNGNNVNNVNNGKNVVGVAGIVGVRPGFGLHDWMTLLRRSKDLARRGGDGAPLRRDIPIEEVRRHDKPYDGWMALRGKVYNVGPYLSYHPGGSSVMEKCLGGDATELFDKYHSWVNLDGLVGMLLLGYLKVEMKKKKKRTTSSPSSTAASKDSKLFAMMPAPPPPMMGKLLPHNNNDDDDDDEDLMTN